MGRRRYVVDDKKAYHWCERHRRGDSFRKIGLDEGYDRRFVAKVVRQYDRQQHIQSGLATLQDVRAGFLKEHLEMLERAAKLILGITAAPSVWGKLCVDYSGGSELDVESILIRIIQMDRTPYDYDWKEGVHPELRSMEHILLPLLKRLDTRIASREAKAILEGLKQHLPELWKRLKQWERIALAYEKNWKSLADQARDMGIELDLFEVGLREGLDFISRSEKGESSPPIPRKLETASDVGLWLFQNFPTRKSLELLRQQQEQLEAVYDQLLDMLSPFELRKALLERQCRYCPMPEGEE